MVNKSGGVAKHAPSTCTLEEEEEEEHEMCDEEVTIPTLYTVFQLTVEVCNVVDISSMPHTEQSLLPGLLTEIKRACVRG